MRSDDQQSAEGHRTGHRLVRSETPEHQHEAVEYALLGLLRDGPAHGYRLAAAFGPSGRLGVIVRLKMSQMYAYLHKLERAGWLTVAGEAGMTTGRPGAQDSGRMRRVYTLTATGAQAFDEWLTTREMRLTFLLKLAFVIQDHAQARRLMTNQRAATANWLARLRAREERIRGDVSHGENVEHVGTAPKLPPATTNGSLIELLTIRQRIHLSEATIAWLDETLKLLAEE
jgi:DNA-binding PadR family transcriptional regulator